MNPESAVQTAVKSANDTVSLDRLFPTLLVYDALPWFGLSTEPQPKVPLRLDV